MHLSFSVAFLLLTGCLTAVNAEQTVARFNVSSLSLEVTECADLLLSFTPPSNDSIYIEFLYQLNDNTAYQVNASNVHDIVANIPPIDVPAFQSTSAFNVCSLNIGRVVISTNSSSSNLNVAQAYVKVSVVQSHVLEIVISVIGWIYFAAWSISFYPQVILNWQRKSVVGLSFDFTVLNFLGHTSYALYNCFYYWDPAIYDQYLAINPRGVNPVQLNDVLFSLHASLLTAVTVVQLFIYEGGDQRVSIFVRVFIGLTILFYLVSLIPALVNAISWLLYLTFFSYVKLLITLIKYVPQAWMNYRRKSTEGWSIINILLDFTGGSLSMLQMILISYNNNDWASMFIDLTKFGLGLFSILFDVLFIVQHYCLYYHSSQKEPAVTSRSDTAADVETGNAAATVNGSPVRSSTSFASKNKVRPLSPNADERAPLLANA